MPRTEEQVKADEVLTESIQNVLKAYEIQDEYVLSDYMLICVQSRIDSEGAVETAYSYLYRNSELPTHVILGLLDIARMRLQHHVNSE